MKRFKAALSCGSWNKEDLVEDENGAFVKYSDVQKLIAECMEWNWMQDDVPEDIDKKFNDIAFGS